jgi:transcriptional regulator with XRE-family HTH domain
MDWLRAAVIKAGGFEEVARTTGISVPHLYAVARGERPLTAKTAAKLAPGLPKVSQRRWAQALLGTLSATDNASPGSVKGKAAEARA